MRHFHEDYHSQTNIFQIRIKRFALMQQFQLLIQQQVK